MMRITVTGVYGGHRVAILRELRRVLTGLGLKVKTDCDIPDSLMLDHDSTLTDLGCCHDTVFLSDGRWKKGE